MKILSLSNDKKILDPNSAVAKRNIDYGELVDSYMVLVPSDSDIKLVLSNKVIVWGVGGFSRICKFIKLYQKAVKILESQKYDIITSQDTYFLGWLSYLLAKKYHLGLELQFHGVEKMWGLRKLITKSILPRANSVRTVSKQLKKMLLNDFLVAEEKITVVPIYVEPCVNIEHLENNNNFVFITACRLVSVKRVEWQIEAMDSLKELPLELWIVGDGSERKKLEKLVNCYSLENKVKFLGWQNKEELNNLYNQANCYILSSISEGWGMSVIEAAYHKLPIIMTNVGCAGEVFKDSESAMIINSIEELIKAMKNIFENSELRNRLIFGALEGLKKLPDKKQTLDLYLESWKNNY